MVASVPTRCRSASCGSSVEASRWVKTPIRRLASDRLLDQPDRRRAPGAERQDGLREQHGVAQRQDRDLSGTDASVDRQLAVGTLSSAMVMAVLSSKEIDGCELAGRRPDQRFALARRASARTSAMSLRTYSVRSSICACMSIIRRLIFRMISMPARFTPRSRASRVTRAMSSTSSAEYIRVCPSVRLGRISPFFSYIRRVCGMELQHLGHHPDHVERARPARSSRSSPGSSRGRARAAAAQLAEQLLGPRVEPARNLDPHRDVQIPAAVAASRGIPLPAQAEHLPALGPAAGTRSHDPVDGAAPAIAAAEHRLHHVIGTSQYRLSPLRVKNGCSWTRATHDQIPARPAERPGVPLTGDPHLGAGVDAGRQQDVTDTRLGATPHAATRRAGPDTRAPRARRRRGRPPAQRPSRQTVPSRRSASTRSARRPAPPPVAPQAAQGDNRSTGTSTSTPATACWNDSSTGTWTSSPRRPSLVPAQRSLGRPGPVAIVDGAGRGIAQHAICLGDLLEQRARRRAPRSSRRASTAARAAGRPAGSARRRGRRHAEHRVVVAPGHSRGSRDRASPALLDAALPTRRLLLLAQILELGVHHVALRRRRHRRAAPG